MSIAVLVNRTSLGTVAPAALASKIADIESVVASAAGLRKDRGDTIKVLAVEFADAGHDLDPVPSPSIVDVLMRQSGTAINAITVLVVVVLLLLFAVRPLTRVLAPAEPELAALAPSAPMAALEAPAVVDEAAPMLADARIEPSLIEDVTNKPRRSPQRRLEQMVEFDETHAAAILKQWVQRGTPA